MEINRLPGIKGVVWRMRERERDVITKEQHEESL